MLRSRIPSLNWLRVFDAAAQAQSFARAAEQLNISPPAVSQQIKALETYLGQALFERRPQQVVLSDAGRAFLPAVREALASLETAAVALFGDKAGAHLTVQVSHMMACGWLAERLHGFQSSYPDIHLQITTGHFPEDFRRTGADLQIDFGSAADFPDSSDYLFGETLFPVAPGPIAAAITKPEDFLKHRLIEASTHRAGWFQLLQDKFGLSMGQADIVFADSTALAFAMSHTGAGIALARAPASDGLMRAHGLHPCLAPHCIPGSQAYYLVQPSSMPMSSAAWAFREWLLNACHM